MKALEITALVSLIIAMLTGILIHPLQENVIIIMIHALSALILLITCLLHVRKHCKKRSGK